MESQPVANSHSGPDGTGFSHSQDDSRTLKAKTTPSSNIDKTNKISQPGSSLYKDGIDTLQVDGAWNTTRNIDCLTRAITADVGREPDVSDKRLTAQALRELDLHPASYFGSSGIMHDVHLGHRINHKGAIPQSCDVHVYPNNNTYFNDPLSSLMNGNRAEHQRENITHMSNNADVGSHSYKAIELWSRTSDQDHMIDIAEDDTTNTDPAWDLAARVNNLAGIGGRFVGSTCEGHASADNFMIGEDFVDWAE